MRAHPSTVFMIMVVVVLLVLESMVSGFVAKFLVKYFSLLDLHNGIFGGSTKVLADGFPVIGYYCNLHFDLLKLDGSLPSTFPRDRANYTSLLTKGW
jgi:hypothetical protein